jgi:FdhE protein
LILKRTTNRANTGPTHRIDQLMEQTPDLAPWLQLYREVLALSANAAWDEAVASITLDPGRSPDLPLLAGATIPLDPGEADATLRRLLTAGSEQPTEDAPTLRAASGAAELGALFALQSAINQDAAALDAGAAALDLAPEAFAAIAHLASVPLLRAAHRALASTVPSHWGQGFCPVCGAWPAAAEIRGLEATRHLRCGRCGGDWTMPTLWCPFCGEHDHTKLSALRIDDEPGTVRVEACETCHGYVKSTTTLRAWPAEEVPLADIATVEWDLATMERDFVRPTQPAVHLRLTITDAKQQAFHLRPHRIVTTPEGGSG